MDVTPKINWNANIFPEKDKKLVSEICTTVQECRGNIQCNCEVITTNKGYYTLKMKDDNFEFAFSDICSKIRYITGVEDAYCDFQGKNLCIYIKNAEKGVVVTLPKIEMCKKPTFALAEKAVVQGLSDKTFIDTIDGLFQNIECAIVPEDVNDDAYVLSAETASGGGLNVFIKNCNDYTNGLFAVQDMLDKFSMSMKGKAGKVNLTKTRFFINTSSSYMRFLFEAEDVVVVAHEERRKRKRGRDDDEEINEVDYKRGKF